MPWAAPDRSTIDSPDGQVGPQRRQAQTANNGSPLWRRGVSRSRRGSFHWPARFSQPESAVSLFKSAAKRFRSSRVILTSLNSAFVPHVPIPTAQELLAGMDKDGEEKVLADLTAEGNRFDAILKKIETGDAHCHPRRSVARIFAGSVEIGGGRSLWSDATRRVVRDRTTERHR